jgi:hypothetical protein
MPDKLGAEYWIARAEEARSEAEAISDGAAKRLMLQIADNYGELAIAAGSWATGRQARQRN